MREKYIELWAVTQAKRRGWWCRKFKSPGKRSAPDRIFAKRGHVFFTEFKATGEVPTELQAQEHHEMLIAGLRVQVCDSRELFLEILDTEEGCIADPG